MDVFKPSHFSPYYVLQATYLFELVSCHLSLLTMPLGLYIHIPFCSKKCHYCNFVITTQSGDSERRQFLNSLKTEIHKASSQYGKLRFDTLYFGGGTPSLLSVDELKELMMALRSSFEFRPEFEFTFEVNPEDVTDEKAKVYRDLGINRISLGVQAFQDFLLEDMNRAHGVKEVREAYQRLRELGFKNINLDLICRLPNQTQENFQDSVKQIIELSPEQITLYDLQVHANTVYGKRELVLPDEDGHFEMVCFAEKEFEKAGFKNYALSCYAKPGFRAKHNLIYWHNEEYLGLGPGAFSYMKGVRYQFAESVAAYLAKCKAGDWQADVSDVLTKREKELETLMTGLRLKEGVALDCLGAIGRELNEKCFELFESEVLKIQGGRVILTKKGSFLAENVFESLVSGFR